MWLLLNEQRIKLNIYWLYVQEFFDHVERQQRTDFEQLLSKYQAIGPLLTKVEGLVVNTNTGESGKLKHYYAHWEMKIFNSLTTVGQRTRYDTI